MTRHLVRYADKQDRTLCGILLRPDRPRWSKPQPKAEKCEGCDKRHEAESDDYAAEYVYDDDLVRC